VGKITITQKQAQVLGLKPYSQLSPLFEKNCLLLSGNESFQDSERDIEALTGITVSHSTLQRLVQRIEYLEPETLQGVSEISIDGGKVRLRSQIKGVESYWRDYKAVRLQGIYYGAFFQDNLSLTDWVNSQRLLYQESLLGRWS
jgi:hypothetical protein